MQFDAERILQNLHVIGALAHNDKLMTNDEIFDIYSPTLFQGVWRMVYRENRMQNINRIRNAIRAGMQLAQKYMDEIVILWSSARQDVDLTQLRYRIDTLGMQYLRICEALENAKGGMANLHHTYKDDSALVSQLQLLSSEVADFQTVMSTYTNNVKQQCRDASHCQFVCN